MDTPDYLKLRKKENKSALEFELLKNEQTLRIISEIVTNDAKADRDSGQSIQDIRNVLNDR